MKNTIKFFATFLSFIFLTTIIQAQTPRDGTGENRTSARIPTLQKQAAKQKAHGGLEMNGPYKKLKKKPAKQKAHSGLEMNGRYKKLKTKRTKRTKRNPLEIVEMNGRGIKKVKNN